MLSDFHLLVSPSEFSPAPARAAARIVTVCRALFPEGGDLCEFTVPGGAAGCSCWRPDHLGQVPAPATQHGVMARATDRRRRPSDQERMMTQAGATIVARGVSKVHGCRAGADARPQRRGPGDWSRRIRGVDGAFRLGQEYATAPPRGSGPADERVGVRRRGGPREPGRRRPHAAAPPPDRPGVPVLQPCRVADRGGERRPAAGS